MNQDIKDLRFQSNYGGGEVTAAQYIIELICTKKATMEHKTLSYKFWQEAEWRTIFRRWTRPVHALLKSYHPLAIVNALNDARSGMRWSVHTEFMIKLIKEHQRALHVQQKKLKVDPQTIDKAKHSAPRKPRNTSSIFNILDEDIEYVDMNIGNG